MRPLFAALLASAALGGLAPRAEAEPSPLTLALAGDVYIDAPTRLGAERLADELGPGPAYRALFDDAASTLAAADLTIINLETPISPRYRERRRGEPPIFNTRVEVIDALVDVGVDAVTLANNHLYDQGLVGLSETLEAARRRGLPVVGVGSDAASAAGPLMIQTSAGAVALCAWTQSVNLLPHDAADEDAPSPSAPQLQIALVRDDTFAQCLGQARQASVLTLAALHWTPSGWTGPGPVEQAQAQAAVDAGADLVIGHGPHLPGPIEHVSAADGREVIVIYSLGNLVGAMGNESEQWRRRHAGVRDAPIVRVTTRREGERLVPDRLEVIPFWIADPHPNSPWWPEGQPLTRPLSIELELERLSAAGCGPICHHRARGYRRHAGLLRAALSTGLALAEPDADESEAPPATPEAAPEDDSALSRLLAGISLPLSFEHNRVAPEITNEEELAHIIELLHQHRELDIHLTGSAVEDEDLLPMTTFGARRARAAMWEISGRGPSRSRFEISGGPVTDEPEVRLRLVP